MTAKVILNPYANRWHAKERQQELETALQGAGISYELTLSERKDHAIELAAQAAQAGFSPVIAAGGDGTLSEVANGLIRIPKNERPPLGLMPLGTANDLVTNLKLPLVLADMAKIIARGQTRSMDVIRANERVFINNAGLGLEPFVTIQHEKISWIRGIARYLVATFLAVMQNPKWDMELEWDDGKFAGQVTLVSISNNPLTGGVFYTVPHADAFDGKLSFIYGYLPSRLKIFKALPMLMKAGEGNISEHPAVHEVHATWLKVHSRQTTPTHADGELFSRAIQDVEYRVVPGGIDILM